MTNTALAAGARRQIDDLLRGQRKRIRSRVLLYGTGLLALAFLGSLALYYFTDRTLRLPVGVRVLFTLAWLVALGWVWHRFVFTQVRARLSRADIAVALERRFPHLHEQLISALQLGERQERNDLRDQSPDMVARLVDQAVATARALPADEFLTWRHVGRTWAAVALALLVAVPVAVAQSQAVGVFLQRMLGAAVSYPRLTSLFVELPPADKDYHIRTDGREVTVTLAAGNDLPVLVRAEGQAPREVWLMVDGGRGMPAQVATAARGGGRFRHVFRRISDDFSFHAAGGDDDAGDLLVHVAAVRPPRVGTIRAALTHPRYSGLPTSVQDGGSIEALQGTEVELQVTPLGAVSAARLVFQESGEQIELTRRQVDDDAGSGELFAGSFSVLRNDRYQVELVSPAGLRNPQGGNYPVIMVPDAPPAGQILVPQDDGLNVVLANARLALRVIARDDFRLTAATAALTIGERQEPVVLPLLGEGGGKEALVTELLGLARILGDGAAVKEGESVSVTVALRDNREPEAQTVELPSRTVHVVVASDLERRIAGHFRRIRGDVEKALELQRERRERLLALRPTAASLARPELITALTGLQVAQGRVASLASRVHVELMRSTNVHLLNPIDESADPARIAELYLAFHRSSTDPRPFVPEFYRSLAAEQQSGRLGSLGELVDRVLAMTASADRVAERLAPSCIQLLATTRAGGSGGSQLDDQLAQVAEVQAAIEAELDALLDRLDEWNDFQDVISTARSLRDQQQDVQSRTKTLRK